MPHIRARGKPQLLKDGTLSSRSVSAFDDYECLVFTHARMSSTFGQSTRKPSNMFRTFEDKKSSSKHLIRLVTQHFQQKKKKTKDSNKRKTVKYTLSGCKESRLS